MLRGTANKNIATNEINERVCFFVETRIVNEHACMLMETRTKFMSVAACLGRHELTLWFGVYHS